MSGDLLVSPADVNKNLARYKRWNEIPYYHFWNACIQRQLLVLHLASKTLNPLPVESKILNCRRRWRIDQIRCVLTLSFDFIHNVKARHVCSFLGAIKVSHFEIACRALGGEPSVPLFRQFFRLARSGDWYTVENRSPAHAVPFKMPWRQPDDESLNDVDPHYEKFDTDLYGLLVKHPTPLQCFPEHILIMAGLSRNWAYVNAEPILKDGDEEKSLVKYMENKGVGAVKLTSHFLAKHENNILDRTQGICYEGGPSRERMIETEMVVKENVSETPFEPEVSASPSKKRKNVLVVSSIGNIVVEALKSAGMRSAKRRRKKIVFSESGESADETAPKSVPELVAGWYERKTKREVRLRDWISRYRMRMTLQHRKIEKLTKKSSTPAKGRKMVAKKTIKVVEALQKELKDARVEGEERLKVEREMVERLNGELEVERHEKLWLQKSLERVSSERQWLIQEGFESVINRLHRSQEYLKPLGAVMSKLWSSGAHDGVVEGYACCKAGLALEHLGLYKPNAEEELRKAADELEHMRFPYVVALSQSTEGTLDDLKALEPEGTNDEEEEVAGGDQSDRSNRLLWKSIRVDFHWSKLTSLSFILSIELQCSESRHLKTWRCIEKLVGSVPGLLKWHERKTKREARLRDRVSRYRAKNVKLVKKVRKLKNMRRLTIDQGREAVAENTVDHAKVVEALQKELEDARAEGEERLKVEREMVEKLNRELEAERRERVLLDKSLERVSYERRWLIEEGFEYVINRLHRSREYLEPLGVVQSKLWSSGAHDGVVEGYEFCKAGVDLEDVGVYKPKAEEELRKAADELEHMRFPYVVALSQCSEGTLDELKALEPIEMDEDEVAGGGDQTSREV
ncbi:hypothetical protein L1987_56986 [Smallanthus sonchifolius]|uniref:Uncharacterized protein n=1 Tax=Smallanthus sonchifolius TaxID=185202 RepID=A0ACB9DBS5_9ASTR|nr:hypothetical protein L1987_56986 [Smallanthus sonchifolius]